MDKDVFDGFTVNVFFCEDSYYLAHFVELPNVWVFGTTPSEALLELEAAWELMKKRYQVGSEPISQPSSQEADEGAFNVPIDAQLYHTLSVEASEVGVNLCTFVARILAVATGPDTNSLEEYNV